MRIARLYLRNYRVYEDPLELEIPPGLVGIYGVNGAGKSALLESILFTLWGAARTTKDEVRTAGIIADCVAEVTFEHEGHWYVVRRTISGANASVRAEAHADGAQVSEGVRDTGRYVHSVLGMDDGAFRASVFAEQKQLAAFSVRRPAERRALVLGLLGITPLDRARDDARRDARESHDQLDKLRALLTDPAAIEAEMAAERAAAAMLGGEAERAVARAEALAQSAAQAEAEHRRLDQLGRLFEGLMAEGKARRAERDGLIRRAEKLETEAAELGAGRERLAELEGRAAGLEGAEERLRLVDAVAGALSRFRRCGMPPEATRPNPDALSEVLERAGRARARLAELEGRLSSASEEHQRAILALDRAAELSGEADCPLCGQALGSAAEAVQAHRRDELALAEANLARLSAERAGAAIEVTSADARAREAQAELAATERVWSEWVRATERQKEALEGLADALRALGDSAAGAGPVPPGEESSATAVSAPMRPAESAAVGGASAWSPEAREALLDRAVLVVAGREQVAEHVKVTRLAASEAATLLGRLARGPALAAELGEIGARVKSLDGELAELREQLRGLDYRSEDLAPAIAAAAEARSAAQAALQSSHVAQVDAAAAVAKLDASLSRLEDARDQHRRLAELGESARHLGRAAELLGTFRNTVVGSVGPRLSAQADELFGELTDREYDGLRVDPESYEIQIRDQGRLYGMDRFSGSETDLANLALRVAISEQVMLLSGGSIGLLVLDEVFGPLDSDRKERMLMALERLRGRFGQVLVVTHDAELKEQLPNAIEVVKLPGRRATARVM